MTIDELARSTKLPVRTIREYHTMRLLPAPERRGRVGIYGAEHVQRLNLISRLQRRGYSLAGIRDLLQAWDSGTGLTAVLGIEAGDAALDETPLRLTSSELTERFPALADHLDDVRAAGLVQPSGDGYLVRSPALLALAADGMLDLAATLRREVAAAASCVADVIADRLILPPLRAGQKPEELAPPLQRGRLLLMQGAASTLADQLGAALQRRADEAAGPDGQAIRAVLEQVRIGVFADAAGNIRHHRA